MQYCAYCGNAVEAVSYAPCPRCGNPSNGAPRPAAPAKGSNAALIIVLVVVGLVVVVAIVGILAAIAIPNLLTAMQRSKQKRTMADIRSVATSIEAYATDHNNEYPKGNSPADLSQALSPTYIKMVPSLDGWGHAWQYACVNDPASQAPEKCIGYVLGSGARDLRFERDSIESLVGQPPRPTTNFDCDIVYSNGNFLEYPEGVQQ
ncbi:MAG: Type secretion system protein [Thermoanaerobaculia bacterium]|jgi:general secretion pathway protein G|nr:Type secretion system protein [Thermoanaerobaculia bacterium]